MWELDRKESWAPKNWCFWTVVLEKTHESPLDWKGIQPVHPKGNQSWIFIGRTNAEAPILWPLDVKNWLIGKDPNDGKDWRQEEKGMIEDEMVGWHHWLNGHEFEQALGVGDGQGSLICCSQWGHKELARLSDSTELNEWYSGILFSHKKEWNITIFRNTGGPRDYHAKWSRSERQIPHAITYLWNLKYDTMSLFTKQK